MNIVNRSTVQCYRKRSRRERKWYRREWDLWMHNVQLS